MKNEISKMSSHLEDIQKQLNAKTNEYDIESEKFKKRLKEKDNTIRVKLLDFILNFFRSSFKIF